MKITRTETTVTAEAETINEALQLLQLSTVKVKRSYNRRKGFNAWKGKHKVLCSQCEKSYKNLKLHNLRKHAASGFSPNSTFMDRIGVSAH